MTDKNVSPELSAAEFSGLFRKALEMNGLEEILSTEKAESDFYTLARLLLDFNSHTNITAITDTKGLILAHFVDCLTVAPLIPKGASVADIGCGGGFPTLPLSIVRPDIKIHAIDSTQKKLNFVSSAANELGLRNITPLCIRAEDGANDPLMRESFDFVTARAVSALPVLCELCLPYLKNGGTFCAMKGPRGAEELSASKNAIRKLGGAVCSAKKLSLIPPAGGDVLERMLILINKVSTTPECYPRAYGKIKNKPL